MPDIVVKKDCATVLLTEQNSFNIERKKAYIEIICQLIADTEKYEIWDLMMYYIIQSTNRLLKELRPDV